MPQPGKLRGSARFGPRHSPCRKFFGACSPNDKMKPDRSVIMQSDLSALEVRGLTKRFDRPAVDALDLTIRTGEFYALLGPNGAGKTTTWKWSQAYAADAGSVSIWDRGTRRPVSPSRSGLGLRRTMIYDKLTPLEISIRRRPWGTTRGFRTRGKSYGVARARAAMHERCEGFTRDAEEGARAGAWSTTRADHPGRRSPALALSAVKSGIARGARRSGCT